MDYSALAELLFPDITKTIDDYEKLYPPRSLPQGAVVTRIAPSPTGFVHLGNLYNAIGERLAHQTGGVFYLRIEDTDQGRLVEGAVDVIYNSTPWHLHVPVALAAMNGGKHVLTEVTSAFTVEDCWKMVETAEQRKVHCMQLENC